MTSLFAAMISFHNAVARYTFALGREHVLPTALGRTAAGVGAPRAASALQSAVGIAIIALYAVAGWEPTVHLFFWLGTTGGFGVLCLLATTAIAVIAFFARSRRGEGVWQRAIAPALAAAALLAMIVAALASYATLLGVTPGSAPSWALPALYAVAAAIGIGYALWLRTHRPAIYHRIGRRESDQPPSDGFV
jgi:amino acid transporter